MVVLWMATVVDLAIGVRRADRQRDAVLTEFFRTEDTLQTIRGSVLLAAIDWRDAFLDNDPERVSVYRQQVAAHRSESLNLLAGLRRASGESAGYETLAALEQEVGAYWDSVVPLLELTPFQRAADMRRVLSQRVVPRRAVVMNITRQVQLINRTRFQAQQREIADLYARAQARMLMTGGLATVLSLVVGGLVFFHVARLERRLMAELTSNVEISADLHRLSARIVRLQEDERRSIARELHDEVGQALTAVKLALSGIRRSQPPALDARIDEARTAVDVALQSTRSLSRLLHPPMLDDMGLDAAIAWHLQSFETRTGIPTAFERVGTERRLVPELETCLFRVTQEATTNIAKHAKATSCRVVLTQAPASVSLTIEDNGCGFDTNARSAADAEGLGLIGIRERVTGFRGTLIIESRVGHGTRVTVDVPALVAPAPVEGFDSRIDSPRHHSQEGR